MKKFKFRMQTILEIREKKLDDERLKLAEIQNILNSQIDILKEMEYRKQKLIDKIDELQNSDEMKIHEICNCRMFLETLNSDIKTQLELIKRCQLQLDEQKLKVQEAYKELKTLENLKEKQKKEYYKEFMEAEIREVDDITISRYKRD